MTDLVAFEGCLLFEKKEVTFRTYFEFELTWKLS